MQQQREIANLLDAIRKHPDDVGNIQAQAAEEINGMFPAILDRAFRGEW
jgi:hypothetical protein